MVPEFPPPGGLQGYFDPQAPLVAPREKREFLLRLLFLLANRSVFQTVAARRPVECQSKQYANYLTNVIFREVVSPPEEYL
jgi:hypothetical protein